MAVGGGPARPPQRRADEGRAGPVRRLRPRRRWPASASTRAFVGTADGLHTPVVFCALEPPEDPPLLFYRRPSPGPDDRRRRRPLGHGRRGAAASGSPAPAPASSRRAPPSSRCSSTAAGPGRAGPLDGARPRLAADVLAVARAGAREYDAMLDHVTSPSATGPRSRWRSAPATPRRRPRRLLDRGLELALVKKGGDGVLVATADAMVTVVRRTAVEVVCGLGAGDAFGGALVPRPAGRLGPRADRATTRTPPARSSPPGWPAPTPCRPSTSSRRSSTLERGRHDRCRPSSATSDRVTVRHLRRPLARAPRASRDPTARGRGGLRRAGAGPERILADRARSSSWPPTTRPAARSASGGDPMAMADRRCAAPPAGRGARAPRRRRRARHARHRRGAAAARRAGGQGRHRLDEPGRPGRRRLDDGRPLHRVRRRRGSPSAARGRQDAAADRRRGRRDRATIEACAGRSPSWPRAG